MTEPKNSLVDQYTSLFKLNGIELHISHGAIEEVVHRALGTSSSDTESKVETGKLGGGGGARGLRRIMEEVLLDAFYESYGSSSVKYILVDRKGVSSGEGVKLFSRGQRFDFEAQVRNEAEAHSSSSKSHNSTKADKTGKPKEAKKESKDAQMNAKRVQAARHKARGMVRARLRRTNRLVDPVIYI